MSIKKSILMLSAMAMAASMNQDFIPPSVSRRPHYRTPTANQKKCKSCAEFYKGAYSCSCPWKNYLHPNDIACVEHYKKRKK